MPRKFVTEEIMAAYHVSRLTVYRWCRSGLLRPMRVPGARRLLFDPAEVEAAIRPALARPQQKENACG